MQIPIRWTLTQIAVSKLIPQRAMIEVSEQPFALGEQKEIQVLLTPVNARSASILIVGNDDAPYELTAGKSVVVELNELGTQFGITQDQRAAALLDAVAELGFSETVWRIGSQLLKASGNIRVADEQIKARFGLPLPYPWFVRHKYSYEPY
jgi:hypothetical protein